MNPRSDPADLALAVVGSVTTTLLALAEAYLAASAALAAYAVAWLLVTPPRPRRTGSPRATRTAPGGGGTEGSPAP